MIRFAFKKNYCGCYVEERISERTRGNAGRPFRRFLHETLYIVSPQKLKLIISINNYKSEWHHLTFAPCFKSRCFCIYFKLSTNYLWPSLHSSQIIPLNNLTFYCLVLNILLHYNELTIPLIQHIHFYSIPEFMPI